MLSLRFMACLLGSLSVGLFAKTVEINMLNNGKEGSMVFEPAVVSAEVGDTLKFLPTQIGGHNSQSVYVPKGAKAWMGPYDQPFEVALTAPGVYIYKCAPHLSLGMVGFVVVKPVADAEAADKAFNTLVSSIYANKDRVKQQYAEVKKML